jgi:DNA-binding MarR family transcriptional regulator
MTRDDPTEPARRPATAEPRRRRPTDDDYARLLTVRSEIRRFERWSAEQARDHGLTAHQHQLMLAVRGYAAAHQDAGLTIRRAADYLLVRHHSAVELIDRCERLGLVSRLRDPDDRRVVRLQLSEKGDRVLAELSGAHLDELSRLTPLLHSLLATLGSPPDRAAAHSHERARRDSNPKSSDP